MSKKRYYIDIKDRETGEVFCGLTLASAAEFIDVSRMTLSKRLSAADDSFEVDHYPFVLKKLTDDDGYSWVTETPTTCLGHNTLTDKVTVFDSEERAFYTFDNCELASDALNLPSEHLRVASICARLKMVKDRYYVKLNKVESNQWRKLERDLIIKEARWSKDSTEPVTAIKDTSSYYSVKDRLGRLLFVGKKRELKLKYGLTEGYFSAFNKAERCQSFGTSTVEMLEAPVSRSLTRVYAVKTKGSDRGAIVKSTNAVMALTGMNEAHLLACTRKGMGLIVNGYSIIQYDPDYRGIIRFRKVA